MRVNVNSIINDPETQQSYRQLWEEQYRFNETLYEDFFTMHSHATLAIITGIVILHLFTSFVFMRHLYRKSGDGIVRQFMRGIPTFVNPPLFCDWEEFYRLSHFNTSISESWNQSKKLFVMFQGLFMVEHAVMLTPMIWLRLCIQRRSAFLEKGPFKEVPDELLSTYNVNLLLIIGVAATIFVPLFQAALAYAYFKFGHPWARVLRAQVFSAQPSSLNEESGSKAHKNESPHQDPKSQNEQKTSSEKEEVEGQEMSAEIDSTQKKAVDTGSIKYQ